VDGELGQATSDSARAPAKGREREREDVRKGGGGEV
jgi:hypothetical protein